MSVLEDLAVSQTCHACGHVTKRVFSNADKIRCAYCNHIQPMENTMQLPELYTKIPVTITAIQFTGDNAEAVSAFIACEHKIGKDSIAINTLEGTMKAGVNDWIIRGVKGEFYPCKPDIFEATYNKA